MRVSQSGIDLIKKFEGYNANAYKCPAGVWTIGYGTTRGINQGDTVTMARAEALLIQDVVSVENAIGRLVKVSITQNQFDALVSFVYNVGEGAFKKSTLLKMINKNNMVGASAQFIRWNKANGRALAGLTRRRQAESELFLQSNDVATMPQAVDLPDKPLLKSRTMANASVAGGAGLVLAAAPAIEPAGKVVELAQNNTQGFLLVLGLALVAFAAVAAFIRYSDRHKL